MAFFYPRKQTVIILVLCMVAVTGTIYYTNSKNPNGSPRQTAGASDSISVTSGTKNENLVIDESAFSDWRNQFSSDTKKATSNKTPTVSKNLTRTDILSRDLFSQFMKLQNSDLLGQQEILDQVTENLAEYHIDSQTSIRNYALSDIRTIPASDRESLNNFALAIAESIKIANIKKTESVIVQEYITKNDPRVLKDLDPIIAAYRKTISSLLAVPVPQVLVEPYLSLLNSYNSLLVSAQSLRVLDTDSVKGLAGVKTHIDGATNLVMSIKSMYDILASGGVRFEFDQSAIYSIII